MKKTHSLKFRILSAFLAIVIVLCSVSASAFAADTFENSISAFPESYKPYLRQLHEKHPNWKFEALITNLDFNEAVDAEYVPNRSLVTNASGYTDIFKSREASDYNASTGTYIQKDGGFVRANKLAIAYYMDPRNFLYDEAIFQFEKLSFDSTFTVNEVESVLKGSFMADKNIEYYNSKGTLVKTSEKYSEVIYEAGKTYNINPCFLASKILNEVGVNGSASVSGLNKNYPGIYNFYNIGAYDGANAIENGLAYASSGTTYGRPWNTPRKSIMGGAQFNAASYIAKGQQTSYLQRFNVNPDSSNTKYTHQYMTNLAGAASPAYTTYRSYNVNSIIDNSFVFLIPVYKNMPGQTNAAGTIKLADAYNQTATVNTTCNVRTGPSTLNQTIGISVPKGTVVNILDSVRTDSVYADSIARYPFWCKISFVLNSATYTGYVNSSYLTLTAQTIVQKGTYLPISFKTNKALEYKFVSSDPSVATVTDDKQINFLKTGTVTVTAYDSLGHYQTVNYKVVSSADSYAIKNVKVSSITKSSAVISFTQNSYYTQYEVYIVNSNGKLIKSQKALSNSVSITGLSDNTSYSVYVRGIKESTTSKNCSAPSGAVAFKTLIDTSKPGDVTGVTAKNKAYSSVLISWDKVSNADGYIVYTYDQTSKTYKTLATVTGKTSFEDASKNAINTTVYSVRSYRTVNGSKLYSSYSPLVTYTPSIKPATVSGVSQASASTSSVKLSWNAVKDATCYQVYKYDSSSKSYKKYTTVSTNTCTVSSLSAGKSYNFKIRAVIKVYDKNFYGSYSSVFAASTAPKKVSGLKLSSVSTTAYTLSWNKVSGATGYVVYKYDSASKKYVRLKVTSSTSLKISSLKAAKAATYKVKAYRKTAAGTFYGTASNAFIAATSPSKPANLKASSVSTSSLKLSWSKVSGADGYVIYKYSDATKKYTAVGKTTSTSLTVKSLKSKTTYKFAVRAYKKTSNVTSYSSYSSLLKVVTK
ncbi:MAG: fibronectin type III domain-containing protein [Acutalibacteraceae bacterium]